ncbi:MAG: disulfide bond formation protein B [Caldilineales bacterium]|nr:disulfide bond formation protein B [Caldilineales bacterium]
MRIERLSLYIALIAAWTAMLGSLYFSEVAGFIPCTLCWYQRILMYPLSVIILVGILRKDDGLPLYVLPFSVFGIFVSSYHYLLQKTDLFEGGIKACSSGVPCSGIWINWLGFITIPFLALTAFLIITIAMVVFLTGSHDEEIEDEED